MKTTKTGALMVDEVVTARRDTRFKDVVRLLEEYRISGLPVVDEDDKVIGVISQTDLVLHQAREPESSDRRTGLRRLFGRGARRADAGSRATTAGGVMSTPAITVPAEATVVEAARRMAEHRVERLPVVDEEDRLVGIVTRRDLLQVFLRDDDEIRRDVQQEVFVDTLWLAPQAVDVHVENGVVTLTGQLERRSEIPIAVGMTRRLDGVVDVVDHLGHRIDDRRLQPSEQALRGIADDWLHKL